MLIIWEEEIGPVPNEWKLRVSGEMGGPFQGHLSHLELSTPLAGDCTFQ